MNAILNSPIVNVAKVAALHANDVDRQGIFPIEAITALKDQKLIGALVPKELEGPGSSLSDIANICFVLGQNCGSTGLIYAMHQIEVAMLLAANDTWHKNFLRQVVKDQLLLASVTSEEGIGGSVRTSSCAVEYSYANIHGIELDKKAPTISYGQYADALLVTARENNKASSSSQVMVTILRDQYNLVQTSTWNTLGMRGTLSHGFNLTSSANIEQIHPIKFGELAEKVMLPVSHMLWSSVWLGIATDALTRARAFLRKNALKNPTNAQLGGVRLADAVGKLHMLHSRIKELLATYEIVKQTSLKSDESLLMNFTTDMNILKISASETALHVVDQALMITGMSGFKNDTPYSVGRHLRDIHSSRLMINNDRIAANSAGFLLTQRTPLVVF